MTRDELLTFTEGLLDGETIDSDLFDTLLTAEKDEVEGMREWEMLKKLDQTKTASTAAKTLPDDFRSPLMVSIGTDTTPLLQIPFEQKLIFANAARRWYIDQRANSYYILGDTSGRTINFFYIYQTDDITDDSGTLIWPARFHKLLGYRVAEKFYAFSQEERRLSWDDKWKKAGDMILNSMIDWDERLKKRSRDNALTQADLQSGAGIFDLGDLG